MSVAKIGIAKMGFIGSLIIIWALAQSLWLGLRKLNRTINPEPSRTIPTFEIDLVDISECKICHEFVEKDIMTILAKKAHNDICVIEDAGIFKNANSCR